MSLLTKLKNGITEYRIPKADIMGVLEKRSSEQTEPYTAQEIISLTNSYRVERGLKPLTTNNMLMKAALERARDMAVTGSFSHKVATTTPNFGPGTFVRNQGYYGYPMGENLAVNFDNIDKLIDAWKKSPSHNIQLTMPEYEDTGIGVAPGVRDGKQVYYVVQVFGKPESRIKKSEPKIMQSTATVPKKLINTPIKMPFNIAGKHPILNKLTDINMRMKTTTPRVADKIKNTKNESSR